MKQKLIKGLAGIMTICVMLCNTVLGAVHIDYNPDGSMKKITFDTNEDRINYQKYHEDDVRLYGTGVEAEVKEAPKFYTYEEIEKKWPIEGFTHDDLEIVKQWFIDNVPGINIRRANYVGNKSNSLSISVEIEGSDYESVIRDFMKWFCTSQYSNIFTLVGISFNRLGNFYALMSEPAYYTTDNWELTANKSHFYPSTEEQPISTGLSLYK